MNMNKYIEEVMKFYNLGDKTFETDFRNLRMKISFRNAKNIDIFSSFLMVKYVEIKNFPPLY